MLQEQVELWQRISSFELDTPGTALPFSKRLARENGWSWSYALRVVEEYRRYVFLAMTAGHTVTPSDEVDQAWHLHMVYTESYWTHFCGEVLGQPFHHGPTKGGNHEASKHDEWYRRTLASYTRIFQRPAPADIWPSAEERFDANHRWQRVDRRDVWVLRKPVWLEKAAMWTLLAASAVSLTGCLTTQWAEIPLFDLPGPQFLAAYFVILVGAIFAAVMAGDRWRRGTLATPVEETQDPYALAVLSGGVPLAVGAAMMELTRRQLVSVQRKGIIQPQAGGQGEGLHPFEREVLAGVQGETKFQDLNKTMAAPVARITAELEARGLMLSQDAWSQGRLKMFMLTAAPVVIGLIKIVIGLQRGKHIAFLLFMVIMAVMLCLIFFAAFKRSTTAGNQLLKRLRAEFAPMKKMVVSSPLGSDNTAGGLPYALPFAIAVFGPSMLVGTPLDTARQHLGLGLSADGSSSSDGGGGGGCSGGGGCGGCGSS